MMRYHSRLRGLSTVVAEETFDPYWNNVVLLQGFDNVNYPDESLTPHGVTFSPIPSSGHQIHDSTTALYGTHSVRSLTNLFQIIVSGTPTDWNFGTGEFTIELSFYSRGDNFGDVTGLVGTAGVLGTGWDLFISGTTAISGGNQLILENRAGGSDAGSIGSSVINDLFSHNQWYRIAVQRKNGIITFFVDGQPVGGGPSVANFQGNNANLYIFRQAIDRSLNGNIDELRITNGVGRYNENGYTPRTSPFPRQ